MDRLLAQDPDCLLVAEVDGRVALVRAAEEHLRARGARRITALVANDPAARALWEAAGYGLDEGMGRFVRNL